MRSAWPIAITTSRLTPLILPTRPSSLLLASGLITDLSKSNNASADRVTFARAGETAGLALGLAAGAAGLGLGVGAGLLAAGAAGVGLGAAFGTRSVSHPAIASAVLHYTVIMFEP